MAKTLAEIIAEAKAKVAAGNGGAQAAAAPQAVAKIEEPDPGVTPGETEAPEAVVKPEVEVEGEPARVPGGLATNCLLVKLFVGGWNARILDKDLTREAMAAKGINGGTGNAGREEWVATYRSIIDPARIKEIKAVATELRTLGYTFTLPWLHSGQALLPCRHFVEFNRRAQALIEKYLNMGKALADDLDTLKIQAKAALGPAYRENDYPSRGEVLGKFRASVSYSPVPASGDIRVDLQADVLEEIRGQVQAAEQAAAVKASADIWQRVYKVAAHMASTLADPEAGFHGTLVGNIADLVAILPGLNWSDDPALEAARKTLERDLCRYDAEALKSDLAARTVTAKAAAQAAANARTQLDRINKLAEML